MFVYVYQPSEKKVATSINISQTEGLNYINYKLRLVNSQGVFFKYVVDNLKVDTSKALRTYEITSIFREFDESIDEGLSDDNENTIDEVSFKVAKRWEFLVPAETVIVKDIQTISITDKYVGFTRYDVDENKIENVSCRLVGTDAHFVAFSADYKIEKLISAQVYYSSQAISYEKNMDTGEVYDEIFYDVKENSVDLFYTDRVEVSDGYFIRHHYSWDRILSVSDFVSQVENKNVYSFGLFNYIVQNKITKEGLEDLKGKDWVLSFVETEIKKEAKTSLFTQETQSVRKTLVGNVSILKLVFENDGYVFNLGTIDNKQTGDGNPDNERITKWKMKDWFKWVLIVLAIVVCVVLFPVIWPILFTIIKFLIKCLWYLLKGLWWLITAPFSLLDGKK